MPSYWPIGGGSQTPWVSDINAGAHNLTNLASVSPSGSTLTVNGGVNSPGYYLNGVAVGEWTAASGGAIYYNSGNVSIGTTGVPNPLTVNDPSATAQKVWIIGGNSSVAIAFQNYNGIGAVQGYNGIIPTGGAHISLQPAYGNVGIGVASPTHLLQLNTDDAAKPSTNTWTISSDIRTKRNVRRFEGDIEVIRKLEPIVAEYNGLAGTPKGQRVVSFDAAELRKLVPPCVSSVKAKLRDGDEEETDVLGVNTHELFFHLLRAVQDIDRRLQGMEHGSKRK